jgi:hypothetical protein
MAASYHFGDPILWNHPICGRWVDKFATGLHIPYGLMAERESSLCVKTSAQPGGWLFTPGCPRSLAEHIRRDGRRPQCLGPGGAHQRPGS